MSNSNLRIIIEGRVGTGKTTLYQFIEKALRKEGFENIEIGGLEWKNDILL